MENKVFKNIIKYTIGLPFIIAISISLVLFGSVILILEILAECLSLIIEGNCSFSYLTGIDILTSAFEIWKPIE